MLEAVRGTGLMFARIVAVNPDGRNFGCDNGRGMLVRAANKVGGRVGVGFQLASVRQLPYPDKSFALVVAAYPLDILRDEDNVVVRAERGRVAKPGARLFAVEMTYCPHWYYRFGSWLSSVSPRLTGGCRPFAVFPYPKSAVWAPRGRLYLTQNTFPSEVATATKPRQTA